MASFDGKTYTHDILGRLTDVELSPGGDTVQMAYDGLGRRISRTNAAGTESYLWAGGQVFEITSPGESFRVAGGPLAWRLGKRVCAASPFAFACVRLRLMTVH